jgi:hypothetical protein
MPKKLHSMSQGAEKVAEAARMALAVGVQRGMYAYV